MSKQSRPRTPAQQDASRTNGAQSRGPVTDIGKQRSSLNALKHGLCAQSVLLPNEDEADCQLLIDDYEQHYRPLTSLELARVREMALCDWRLRRTVEMERGLLSLALLDAEKAYDYQNLDQGEILAHAFRYSLTDPPALTLLLRYQAQLQRSQERARKALKQLQAERQQQEHEQQAITPNEPEPAANHPANKLPNEPKLTRQQRRHAERQRAKTGPTQPPTSPSPTPTPSDEPLTLPDAS